MLVEVAVVIVFDFVVVGRGGDSGLSLSPLNALSFAAGGEVWVGLLFAMLVFIGFEATALYRDEVRDPDRTIPRATYIAVSFIGILYTVSVLVMVLALAPAPRTRPARIRQGCSTPPPAAISEPGSLTWPDSSS